MYCVCIIKYIYNNFSFSYPDLIVHFCRHSWLAFKSNTKKLSRKKKRWKKFLKVKLCLAITISSSPKIVCLSLFREEEKNKQFLGFKKKLFVVGP